MLGLLFFLPALIVLPIWTLYKIFWRRRWTPRNWLMLPLVALLFIIALVVPNPGNTPQISPLWARFFVAFWLLPMTMFPWQLVAWFRAGRRRRLTWWLGITGAITLLVGTVIYTIHWRMTPRDEYWVYNIRSAYPFLLGLYFSATLCIATVAIEHCLWRPLMSVLHRLRSPKSPSDHSQSRARNP